MSAKSSILKWHLLSSEEAENTEVIFVFESLQGSLCSSKFEVTTPGENVNRQQFLHNLFTEFKLEMMCPCENPPPQFNFPLCAACEVDVESLWRCEITPASYFSTKLHFLLSIRGRAYVGMVDELNNGTVLSAAGGSSFFSAPPPVISPEKQKLFLIRNAIATGQQPDCSLLSISSLPTAASQSMNRSVTRMDKIAGADGNVYTIIPWKIKVENEFEIIKCFGAENNKQQKFYMCRRCRITLSIKNLKKLKGDARPFQRIRAHLRSCTGEERRMPTLKPASDESLNSAPASVDRVSEVTQQFYSCPHCQFRIPKDFNKHGTVTREGPSQRMKAHVQICQGRRSVIVKVKSAASGPSTSKFSH